MGKFLINTLSWPQGTTGEAISVRLKCPSAERVWWSLNFSSPSDVLVELFNLMN